MHRPLPRNIKRKQSQEPKPLLQQEEKKANHIKTRMQSKMDLLKDTRKPMKFANHTNLPHLDSLTTKENISRSEEDTKVTEQDESGSELVRSVEEAVLEVRVGRSCLQVAAYQEEIRDYVLGREEKYMIEHSYMRNHRVLNLKMRSYLVKYIFRISFKYSLLRTTTYLAVHYMDLYFSRVFAFRDQFETVAVAQTCLFIAMKYEEIYPPDLSEWVDHRYKSEILRLEADILRALDFQLAHYTLEHFLHFQLWEGEPLDSQNPLPAPSERTLLLMDLSLYDLPMRQFRPSHLAQLLHLMGKPGSLESADAEKQDRLMVQHVMWMIERNTDALKYLVEQKYRGIDLSR